MPDLDSEGLRDLARLHEERKRGDRLEKRLSEYEHRGHGGGNGGSWAAKAVFQIVVGLFLLMLTAIVGVMWARLDRFDTIQQSRGERVRALEQQMDDQQRRTSENRSRMDYLYNQVFQLPTTLPSDAPPPRHRRGD